MGDRTLLDKLAQFPVVTVSDVERLVDTTREYARLILHRRTQEGAVYRIERGKYTVHDDPLIIGTHLIQPSYFSLWTALRYYDHTTQLPQTTTIMHSTAKDDISFHDTTLSFHQTQYMYGYHKERYRGFDIFMADPEKLLIDCLHSNIVPVDELDTLLDDLDEDRVTDYTVRTDSPVMAKRVGYLIDPGGENRERLQAMIDANTALLDPTQPDQGERNTTWHIIDNR